jgi:hypothetical protein
MVAWSSSYEHVAKTVEVDVNSVEHHLAIVDFEL